MNPDSDLETCCNSGCNHCVLDKISSIRISEDYSNKINVLSDKYINFRISSIKQCTSNVFRFILQYSNDVEENLDNKIIYIPEGHHIQIRAPKVVNKTTSGIFLNYIHHTFNTPLTNFISSSIKTEKYDKNMKDDYVSRFYTPIRVNPSEMEFEILVKLEPLGLMSTYFQTLNIGDLIELKGSYGEFSHVKNKYKKLICFSQGVGVAPIYRLFRSILIDDEDETMIHLYACFQDVDHILLRDEIYDSLKYWNFHAEFYLSKQENLEKKVKFNETIHNFRLVEEEILKIYCRNSDNALSIICGTENFVNMIKNCLINRLGVKNGNIFIF